MAKLSPIALTAEARIRREGRVGATDVRVLFGTGVVARAELGGRWSPAQVLAEFRKNRARFKPGPAWELAQSAGLL